MKSDAETNSAQAASSVSSFSPLPSEASISFVGKLLAPLTPRRGSDDSSLNFVFEAASTLFPSTLGIGTGKESSGPPRIDDLVTVAAEQDATPGTLEEPQMNAKKKSLIHAMKKAGSRAARKLASRSWGRHHSRLTSAADVQAVFDEPTPKPAISHASESNCDQTSTGANVAMEEVSNGSTDSLTAVHGSPETKCFESPPILCARDSVLVARCQETRVRLPLDEGFPPMRFTVFRFCLQMLLFIPYVVLVGFLPFLAPTCLSRVTFNSFLRFTIRPAEPMEVFAQYSRQLPWHVGVALGLLFVATRALGKAYPGLAVALMAALIGRTMWAWGDFDSTLDVGDACLGIDDRATIWWLLRGFVLGDLVCSMDDFRKWYVDEKDIDSGEEDGEMETLERKDSSGKIDFGIRLRNRPQECFRIVADCEESF